MARFNGGWIKLHRSLNEKDIMQNLTLLGVWVYILTNAVYKDSQIIWNGKQRILKPGECVLGVKQISDQWSVSQNTIWKWVKYLQDSGRIQYATCTRGTIVTICNWEEFQTSYDEGCIPNEQELQTNCKPTENQVRLNEEGKKERKNTRAKKVGLPGIRVEYTYEFSQLWELYNRGTKNIAFEVFKSLSLSPTEIDDLHKSIKFLKSRDNDWTYRKYFETFLKMDWRDLLQSIQSQTTFKEMQL